MPGRTRLLEWLIVALAFVAVSAASFEFQRPVSRAGGKGWDGIDYYAIAEQLVRGDAPSAHVPYVYRIGTPFLASRLAPNDLIVGFEEVNAVACALATVLLVVWLRRHLSSWWCRTILCLLFVLHWLGPARFVYFYPVYVDPWALVFVLGGWIAADRAATEPRSPWPPLLLGAIAFVGVAFRQVVALVPIALLFAGNPIDFRGRRVELSTWLGSVPRLFWLPVGASLLGGLCVWLAVHPTGSASFALSTAAWVYKKSAASWILAWFIVFGPVVAVVGFYWRETFDFLARRQDLLVYLTSIAILGWVGGSDTERILWFSLPVTLVLIGRVLEAHHRELTSWLWLGLAVSTQLVSERVFWTIPDPAQGAARRLPFLTPLGSDAPYFDLYSHHGDPRVEAVMLAQYLAVALLLALVLRRTRGKPWPRVRGGGGANA